MKKSSLAIGIFLFLVVALSYPFISVQAAEPSLATILNTLGFNNITLTNVQKFSAGTYNISLLAEYAGYHAENNLSYYQVSTSVFNLIFSGPEGGFGYVTPPISKAFTINYQFGLSMFSGEGHRYFTETSRNPDGYQHAKVYENLDVPGMYFVGFENLYGSSADRDYNDMVVSLCPQYQITFNQTGVDTDFTGTVVTVDGIDYGVGALPKSFWWNKGSSHSFSLRSPLAVTANAKQYLWNSTSGLSSLQSGSIIVSTSGIVTGNYKTQYLVTFAQTGLDGTATGTVVTINGIGKTFGQLPNSTWFDSGSLVTYSYSNVSSTATGKRFNLTSITGPASPFSVTSSMTATGNYKIQYRLIMSTNFGTTNPSVGDHWYEAGTVIDIQAFAPSVIPGERYAWNGWTGTGSGSYSTLNNPASITMNGPITETASWTHQFLLTIKTNGLPSTYPTTVYLGGIQVGSAADASPYTNWFDAGTSTGTIGVNGTVPGATGTRYVFVKWVEDSSTFNPRVSEIVNAPKTFTADHKTQYLLTVRTDPSGLSPQPTRNPTGEAGPAGSWWYDNSTDVTLTAQTVAGYTFSYCDVDGTSQGSGVNPITVHMNAPHTITAHYTPTITYTLTIITATGGTTNPAAGTYTYTAGTTVQVTAIPDANYNLDQWELDSVNMGSANPYTVTMDKDHTLKAVFKLVQYQITFSQSGVGPDFTGTVVIIDGINHKVTDLSKTFLWDVESLHTFAFQSPLVVTINAKQYVWTDTTGLSTLQSGSITVSGSGSVTGNYKTQYAVTFTQTGSAVTPTVTYTADTDPTETVPFTVWVKAGTQVTYTYQNIVPSSSGVRYTLTSVTPSSPQTVNGPMTISGTYQTQYYLTVTSPYDSPTPTAGWFDAGPVTASVTSPSPGPAGTQYLCIGWTGTGSVPASGTGPTVTFSINAPSSITWNWKTQYYLTVKTNPSGITTISGEGWYDSSSSVSLTAPSVAGYDFTNWDVDGVSQGAGVTLISITMNPQHTATAHYTLVQPPAAVPVGGHSMALIKQSPTSSLIATYVMLIAMFSAMLSLVRRKRKW